MEMGLPEPKFEEFGDGIKVTIYRAIGDTRSGIDYTGGASKDVSVGNNDGDNGKTVGNDGENVGEKTMKGGDIKNAILSMIINDNKSSAASIAKAVSVTPRTVERYVKELREEGVLIRHGSARGGYWEVRKEREYIDVSCS